MLSAVRFSPGQFTTVQVFLMPQGQLHDDVLELCRSVPFDPSAYKKFEFAVIAHETPADETRAHRHLSERLAGPALDNPGFHGRELKSKAICPAAPAEPSTPRPAASEVQITNDISVSLLEEEPVVSTRGLLHATEVIESAPNQDSIGSNLSALAAVHTRTLEEPALLPVISGVGGSGATTVLAGLGRALSILGERVLLVDTQGPSTLDRSYQSNTGKTSLLLSTASPSQLGGGVHVLRTHTDTPCGNQSYITKYCRATAGLSGHLDRVLIAGTEWPAPAFEQRTGSGSVCLVILTPEWRSVVAISPILKTIADRSRKTGWNIEPWFLLNRFVESSAIHANVRNRLSAQLGSRLLPFYIPETDLVEHALMQERNVLDIAPEAAFSNACFDLAEWYRATSTNTAWLESRAEETQLVSERS
jgi:cellulose biosynthesis protein BcsQ